MIVLGKKLTLDDVKEKFKGRNFDVLEVFQKGKEGSRTSAHVRVKCRLDGYEWSTSVSNLMDKSDCPACSLKALSDRNRLSLLRPDLIKYLENPEDANNYTVSSGRKIKTLCPDCGYKSSTTVSNLTYRGYYCGMCSDKIPISEKFMSNLLISMGLNFKPQKGFGWSEKRKYDFYIPSLNMIIETHGIQHYEERTMYRKRTLEEEKENDKLKYDLATKNGFKTDDYIEIDCRYSEFDWLKENCINSLSSHFDLSNVDWLKIWGKSQNKIIKTACNLWMNKQELDTANTLCKELGVSGGTLVGYLKIGAELGWCDYDAKTEVGRIQSRNGYKLGKVVCQYTLDGEFIKEYESCHEAGRQLNISYSHIASCCRGTRNTIGGFKWKYKQTGSN